MNKVFLKLVALTAVLLMLFAFDISGISSLAFAGDENYDEPVKYNIKISEDIVNGRVYAQDEGAEREGIEVYVTPDEGYRIDSVTIVKNDGSGEEVPFADIYGHAEGNEKGSYGYFYMPACEVVISAVFTEDPNPGYDDRPTYVVTFITELTQNGPKEYFTQEVKEGDKAVRPEDPYKENYEFTGWYWYPELTAIEDCNDLYDFDTSVTDDYRLIAKYVFVDVDHGDDEPLPDSCPNGHDYGDWIIERPAECEAEGEAFRICERCGAVESKSLPALHHDFSGQWVVLEEPTCTGNGLEATTCVRCSQVDRFRDIPAVGHKWDSGTITKEPAGTEKGIMTYQCTVCGEIRTEDIPAKGRGEIAGDDLYSIASGAGTVWTVEDNGNRTITVKRTVDDETCFERFRDLKIDGTSLIKDEDYTVTEGSAVITIRESYLSTLSNGNHKVEIIFEDGQVETTLVISRGDMIPKTGDTTNVIWFLVMCISVFALTVVMKKDDRYKSL